MLLLLALSFAAAQQQQQEQEQGAPPPVVRLRGNRVLRANETRAAFRPAVRLAGGGRGGGGDAADAYWTQPPSTEQYVVALSKETTTIPHLLSSQNALVSFIPPTHYVALLPSKEHADALSQLEDVSFVAPFPPEYRVDPALSNLAEAAAAAAAIEEITLDVETVDVEGFNATAAAASLQRLLPGGCVATPEQYSNDITVRCTPFSIAAVEIASQQPYTQFVSLRPRYHTTNLQSASILQSGGGASALDAFPIWQRGLRGQSQIVGIGDTGLDVESCYFRDPKGNSVGANHSQVIAYRAVADDVDDSGHGTHVAGSLSGHAGSNGRAADAMYDGMAPLSRVVFTDLGFSNSPAIVAPPGGMVGHYEYSYARGARINSDSWGSESPHYTTQSAAVDRFTWRHLDFLPILASGNDGEYFRGIAAPATAKNGLTVGATLGAETSRSGRTKENTEGDTYILAVESPSFLRGESVRVLKGTFGRPLVTNSVYNVAHADPKDACVDGALRVRADDDVRARPSRGLFGDWERIIDILYGGSRPRAEESVAPVEAPRPAKLKAMSGGAVTNETLLLVQRGGCYFVDKILAAHAANAGAALVYNDRDTGFFKMYHASRTDEDDEEKRRIKATLNAVTSISGSKYTGYQIDKWRAAAERANEPLRLRVMGVARSPARRFDNIAEFSSFGPTTDGRLKPDIVAPGELIRSAASDMYGICTTRLLSGTSMAAPLVGGSAVLVRQYFTEGFYPTGARTNANRRTPSSALIKAVLLNGATNMDGFTEDSGLPLERAPSSRQGFGRILLADSLVFADEEESSGKKPAAAAAAAMDPSSSSSDSQPPRQMFVYDFLTETDANLGDGEEHRFCVSTPSFEGTLAHPLKVTLAWTDYPASSTSSDDAPLLTNDLDLAVGVPTGQRPASTGGLSSWPDRQNNVERLIVSAPNAGSRYIISVKGHAVRMYLSYPRQVGQPYALVVVGPLANVTKLAQGEACGDGAGSAPAGAGGGEMAPVPVAASRVGSAGGVPRQQQQG